MVLGKDKVRPDWPIDIETAELFKDFVLRKYGRYSYGRYGDELNRIILDAIKKFDGKAMAHAHAINRSKIKIKISRDKDKTDEQRAKALELRDKVVRYLIERLGIVPQSKIKIGYAFIKRAICDVAGVSDDRAIKSRITLLESSGLLLQTHDLEYKLYEIITGLQYDLDSKSKEELR